MENKGNGGLRERSQSAKIPTFQNNTKKKNQRYDQRKKLNQNKMKPIKTP